MKKQKFSLAALKHKDFRLFWFGSFISQMGDQMQIVAVSWQLYILTHNAASLGIIGLASFIPLMVFSLPGGVVADKVDRKVLLVACQSILAILAFILYFVTKEQLVHPWMVYTILALSAVGTSFNNPARQSVIVNLVPRKIFMNAVSLNSLQRQAAIVVGPAIAGFLIAVFGVESVYLFNAVSFMALLASFAIIFIPHKEERSNVELSLQSIKEGIKFVIGEPILYSTMILDFLATFFGTASILMPIFANDVLKVGSQGLGFLYAAPAVGGVLVGLYFSGRHKVHHQGKIIITSILIYGAAIIGFGLSRNFILSLALLSLMGMGDMISAILRNTLRQLLTPDEIRGRMVSINMLFVQGGPKLGDAEAGFLAKGLGAPIATIIGGAGTILITLLIAKFVPRLTNYQGEDVSEI